MSASHYPSSILQENTDYCFVCGRYGTDIHHVMGGVANRPLSTKYGLVVGLCREHHTGNKGVHRDAELQIWLKKEAQEIFEEKYGHLKWMEVFGKSYV